MNIVQINFFIALNYFDLDSLFSNFVFDLFSLELVKNISNSFLKTSWFIKQIDLSSHLFYQR
jgi:hypothetical protein